MSSPRSASAMMLASFLPVTTDLMLIQPRCTEPDMLPASSGSPPSVRTSAWSSWAICARSREYCGSTALACGSVKPSAAVRNPSSPSVSVSISELSVEITLVLSIRCTLLLLFLVCPKGEQRRGHGASDCHEPAERGTQSLLEPPHDLVTGSRLSLDSCPRAA